jgi:thymidylate kinase
VREVYLKYVEENQLVRLDGNKPKRAVAKELMRTIKEFLEKSC